MAKEDYTIFQIRLPTPIHEAFYRLFPGHGDRKRVLESIIVKMLERSRLRDDYAESILRELEEGEE